MEFHHVSHPTTLLSQGYVIGPLQKPGKASERHIPNTGKVLRSLWLPVFSPQFSWRPHPLGDLLQSIALTMHRHDYNMNPQYIVLLSSFIAFSKVVCSFLAPVRAQEQPRHVGVLTHLGKVLIQQGVLVWPSFAQSYYGGIFTLSRSPVRLI